MRLSLGRSVHIYYAAVLILLTGLFAYGVKHYWQNGVLNVEFVSNLYDGTSRIKSIKERNDVEDIKKYVDGDRLKEARKSYERLESDIKDLKTIKSPENESEFNEKFKDVKTSLNQFQASQDLSGIINNFTNKVSQFESFVTEKRWPTLIKMTVNLRNRLSPSRLMIGGMYSFERTKNLTQSINNDLEALKNFTLSSNLEADIKQAIVNRIQVLKDESSNLNKYIEERNKFNGLYKEFSDMYAAWFKQVEPSIALKKIEFETSSQTVFYSLIGVFALMVTTIVMGFIITNHSSKNTSSIVEKLIIDSIKDGLLPQEAKKIANFSPDFNLEFDKYRDYAHKRMAFGSIFQEAVPFATILLDSNLNMVWGNEKFYAEWKLENFKDDEDSLTWDFLQRFTDLSDNSSILSALRMSTSGAYKINVKSNTMAEALPYEMYVNPVEYSTQKRIMIIFYPLSEHVSELGKLKTTLTSPLVKAIDLHLEESITNELSNEVRQEAELAGVADIYSKINQYVHKNETQVDGLNLEIEELQRQLADKTALMNELKKNLALSYANQKSSIETYNHFKYSFSTMLETKEQLEEQFKTAMNSTRELSKDQGRIFNLADKSEKSMDDYVKSLKRIAELKQDFKELKSGVNEFKSRIVQSLDQLLIFQTHEVDVQRMEQFLGKIKLELKGFDKVLVDFNEVVTQLDVTIAKIDIMIESREKIDLDSVRYKIEGIKNTIEHTFLNANKFSQISATKDEELVGILKEMVFALKDEMKRVNEMCALVEINPATFQSSDSSQDTLISKLPVMDV